MTEATLPAIETATGWTRLTDPERLALVDRLTGLGSTDRAEVARRLGPLPKVIEEAVWDALAVRDPEAPVIADRKGHREPDPDLRDNENVPLPGPLARFDEDPTERLATRPYRDGVDAYMAAEVHLYTPDAHEIPPTPLTRQFCRYVPPR